MLQDTKALHRTLSDAAVMEYIEKPFDLQKTGWFILHAAIGETPLVYGLIWQETGGLIGHVIFHPYGHNDREIGWVIHPDYWGRGIAREVTAALIEQAKKEHADGCVIECSPQQAVSRRIALKYGFEPMGETEGCMVYRLSFNPTPQ